MLARLLALVADGRLHTPGELAAELGVSTELVEAMLAELQRHGDLAPAPSSCHAGCTSCPMNGACARAEGSAAGATPLRPAAPRPPRS